MAEGPMLDETNCSSFIGRWSMPIRHSCTLGELGIYFSDRKVTDLDINVVAIKNWTRDQIATDFYPTSPAIKNISTALVYPGMGLLEGVNVNEGRGTENPFMQFGAPWIDAEELKVEIDEKGFEGIDIKTTSYTPIDSVYKGERCHGIELKLTDEYRFYPVAFGIDLISTLFKLYPGHLRERAYITNVNPSGGGHLDKLIGIRDSVHLLRSGTQLPTGISPYLLYN
jgi:uncharacterized protein YbbC (DUF1343 family)